MPPGPQWPAVGYKCVQKCVQNWGTDNFHVDAQSDSKLNHFVTPVLKVVLRHLEHQWLQW